MSRYIVIEGPIGVGKTSLTGSWQRSSGPAASSKRRKATLSPQFYQDRKKYAFQTQVFFLLSRFQQQKEIAQLPFVQSGHPL